MANRLTKGKALVGSLDVQGELTINGAPVGAGGSSGTPIAYQMYRDPENDPAGMATESWQMMGSGAFIIRDTPNNTNWTSNFLLNNNIQNGDAFDVTDVEYFKTVYDPSTMSSTYSWSPIKYSGEFAGYTFYAVAILDYMSYQPQLRIGTYGNATYSMMGGTFRFNLRKKG